MARGSFSFTWLGEVPEKPVLALNGWYKEPLTIP